MSEPLTRKIAREMYNPQTPLLHVSLFGKFQFAWQIPTDTQIVAWDSRTSARAVFKLLLCAPGRQASKSLLAGILWPETDEEKARESLRSACKVLRKVLLTPDGEALLTQRNNGDLLVLAEQARLWVDADAFEELLAAASRASSPDAALALWEQANALLCGEFLADDQGYEWASHRLVKKRRQVLWMARCRMVRHLADEYIQRGHINLAEEILERHIATFPTDQDALYRLLVLLEQQECFEQANVLYERTRRMLEAAGKQPAKHLQTYYERLQRAAYVQKRQDMHSHIPMMADRSHQDFRSVSQPESLQVPQHIHPIMERIDTMTEQLLHDPVKTTFSQSTPGDLLSLLSPTIAQGIIGEVRGAENQDMNVLRRKILQELFGVIGTILALLPGTEPFLTPEPWERLFAATSGLSMASDDTFDYFLQLIETCWGLCNAGEINVAKQVLGSFLPGMIQLAPFQPEAALVAAQGLRLQSILCAHQLRLTEMVSPSQLAVSFARVAHNADALSAALNGLAVAFKYAGDLDSSFNTYQEALAYSAQASPLLRSRVYAGSASMFALRGRFQEALFYVGLAYEHFPDHPETDPHFLSADNGIYMLAYYQGLMYLAMNQPEEADKAFESYKRHPLGITIPERNRLEIINHQGRVAIMEKDLDKYISCLKEGLVGAIALRSKKRFDEAVTIYQRDVPERWHRETAIKQMAEQFQLPAGAE